MRYLICFLQQLYYDYFHLTDEDTESLREVRWLALDHRIQLGIDTGFGYLVHRCLVYSYKLTSVGEKGGWRFVTICQSRQWSASNSEVTYRNQSQPSRRHRPAFITPLRDLIKALNDQIKDTFMYWLSDSSRIYWALARCQAPKLMPKGDVDPALGEPAHLTPIKVRDHCVTKACGR